MGAFQFLTTKELEANVDRLFKKTVEKYGDRENIPEDRRKQFNRVYTVIHQWQWTDLPDEEKAKIITGALLYIKSEIELACKKNAAWWFKPYIHHPERYIYKPENSIVYSHVDHAIGITETNPLDEASKRIAYEAFRPYLQRINLFNDIKETKIATFKQANKKKFLTLADEIKNFDSHALHHISQDRIEKKLPIKIFKKTEAYMTQEGATKYKYYKLARVTYRKMLVKDKMPKGRFETINQMKEAIKSELGKVVMEAFSKRRLTLDFFSKDKEKMSKITEAINRSIDTIFTEEIFSDGESEALQEKMIDKMVDRLFLEITPKIKAFDISTLKHVETRVKSVIPFLEELRIEELENNHKLTLSK